MPENVYLVCLPCVLCVSRLDCGCWLIESFGCSVTLSGLPILSRDSMFTANWKSGLSLFTVCSRMILLCNFFEYNSFQAHSCVSLWKLCVATSLFYLWARTRVYCKVCVWQRRTAHYCFWYILYVLYTLFLVFFKFVPHMFYCKYGISFRIFHCVYICCCFHCAVLY